MDYLVDRELWVEKEGVWRIEWDRGTGGEVSRLGVWLEVEEAGLEANIMEMDLEAKGLDLDQE